MHEKKYRLPWTHYTHIFPISNANQVQVLKKRQSMWNLERKKFRWLRNYSQNSTGCIIFQYSIVAITIRNENLNNIDWEIDELTLYENQLINFVSNLSSCCDGYCCWFAQLAWNRAWLKSSSNGYRWIPRFWFKFENLMQCHIGYPNVSMVINRHTMGEEKL